MTHSNSCVSNVYISFEIRLTVKLGNQYNPSQVIVHGISLGGATTNFLSGIDQFINNGPTKINTQIKSLRELKVVGLVEDCGYTDMTQFADESYLIDLNIGLTEENFEYYSNAENSLKYCDIPMLIIQGDSDFIVKPENAETVKNTVKGEVEYWSVKGGAHAFIVIGMNADDYKAHVQNFIDTCNNTTGTTTPDKEPVEDAVVKLIEVCYDYGKEERNPVSHTFTDKDGEFVFGPLCPDKKYEIQIWVDRVKHCKQCVECKRHGKCLKGVKLECKDYHKPE